MQQNPLTLDEVKSHFDLWRTTRTKKRGGLFRFAVKATISSTEIGHLCPLV